MKCLVVIAAILVCTFAEPGAPYAALPLATTTYTAGPGGFAYNTVASTPAVVAPAPVTYAAAGPALLPAPAPVAYAAPSATQTRYHAQDELGQASYGHAEPGQAHSAVRDAAGNVRGSFAYVNPEGQQIRVDYTAGHGGYQVASNALPIAPADTPEVSAAKLAHFQETAQAQARNAAVEGHSRKKRGLATASTFVAPTYYAATPAYYYNYASLPVSYASTYSYYKAAPAPVVRKVVPVVQPAPVVKKVVPSPVPVRKVKTFNYAAPVVRTYTYTAPIVKTYIPAPVYKTYAATPVYKTYAYAPSFYSYAAPYGYGYNLYG